MNHDPRLDAVLEQLQRFAGGDLKFRGTPSEADDEIDAIVVGLNLLADDVQLQHDRSAAALADMAELFERAPVMLLSLDLASGAVLAANETLIERHGPSSADVVGVPLREHVAASARSSFDAAIERLRTGVPVRDCQLTLATPGRTSPYVALLSGVPVEGDDRRARCTIVDIDDRRRLEAQLLEARKMEAIGRLAGGVAHDFNNLLTIITNHAELAWLSAPDDSELGRDLQTVLETTKRAAALTEQLLAFSRRQVIRPTVLALGDLIKRTHRLLRRSLGENVEIVVTLDPDCWPVELDAGQFEQILINLAVNARDAMPTGGRLAIETRNARLRPDAALAMPDVVAGDYVVLTVADSGMGMTAEDTARVFEPFFTTKEGGTGLGLATCYGVVRQAGGAITVTSEVGRGTVFTIYLPRVHDRVAPLPVDDAAPDRELRGSETIVVLEDDPGVRAVAARILVGAGYSVLTAETGEQAHRLFAEHGDAIDLLLSDVVLRHTTGSEVAKSLRAKWPALRTVFVSGYAEESIAHDGKLEPGVDFLSKPFQARDLLCIVRTALDRPSK